MAVTVTDDALAFVNFYDDMANARGHWVSVPGTLVDYLDRVKVHLNRGERLERRYVYVVGEGNILHARVRYSRRRRARQAPVRQKGGTTHGIASRRPSGDDKPAVGTKQLLLWG